MTIPDPRPLTEDILTLPEIAVLTGTKRGTVESWRFRSKGRAPIFIEPDDHVGAAPVWRLERVLAWAGAQEPKRPTDVKRWRKLKAQGAFQRGAANKTAASELI